MYILQRYICSIPRSAEHHYRQPASLQDVQVGLFVVVVVSMSVYRQ